MKKILSNKHLTSERAEKSLEELIGEKERESVCVLKWMYSM